MFETALRLAPMTSASSETVAWRLCLETKNLAMAPNCLLLGQFTACGMVTFVTSGVVGGVGSTVGAATSTVGNTAGTVGGTVDNRVGATMNAAGSVGRNAGAATTASGQLTSSARGVVGLQGMQLSWAAGGAAQTQGSLITSGTRDVHLDGGTQMVLQVTGSAR